MKKLDKMIVAHKLFFAALRRCNCHPLRRCRELSAGVFECGNLDISFRVANARAEVPL